MNASFGAIRFGYGFDGTRFARPSGSDLLNGMVAPDPFGNAPLTDVPEMLTHIRAFRKAQRASKEAGGKTPEHRAFLADIRTRDIGLRQTMVARALSDQAPFRERVNWFWMDHFTVEPKGQMLRFMLVSYLENAIRPNVSGRFADLLWAVISHPAMLFYLDNQVSRGPNSRASKGGKFGLNENLARELLELHTLGVQGGYSQTDVTELAELLTGLRVGPEGTHFAKTFAEPGPEMILGQVYSENIDTIDAIKAFVEDIAMHPTTAQHLAQKMATHFISDEPDPKLVEHMRGEYLHSGGELMALYSAMIEHPSSWASFGDKVKQPFDYFVSGLRALGVGPKIVRDLSLRQVQATIMQPIARMGQPMFRSGGPDGWPEHAEAWITADGLAGRVAWAGQTAERFGAGLDPRDVMINALGDLAGDRLSWAVPKASNRVEGLALILASPAFNRR